MSSIVFGVKPPEVNWFRGIKLNRVFDIMIIGIEFDVVGRSNKKFQTVYMLLQQDGVQKFLSKTFQFDNKNSGKRWAEFKAVAGLPQVEIPAKIPGHNFKASVTKRKCRGQTIYDFVPPKYQKA